MCTTKDINHRPTLGNAAFQSFKKVWINSWIPVDKKVDVYEAQGVSVITLPAGLIQQLLLQMVIWMC